MGDLTVEHEVLAADALRTWVHEATELLTRARPVIDRANVFPVADADTGTNMCLTLAQGRESVDALTADADVDAVLDALARGALLGARGNSGVILSEYLRGFAAGARSAAGAQAAVTVAVALREAARSAYDAVGQPRRGTILTAAAGAGDAAGAALDAGADLAGVLAAARAGAHDALRRSADDLDVLRAAGVLDAGAYGLVLVLDALARALARVGPMSAAQGSMTSVPVLSTLSVTPSAPDRPVAPAHAPSTADLDGEPARHGDLDGEFEVMFVIESVESDSPALPGEADVPLAGVAADLRSRLAAVGSSVAVVGGVTAPGPDGRSRGLWQVHVHTDRPLEALAVGERWTQRQVVVRSLAQQVSCASAGVAGSGAEESAVGAGGVGVVACTASPGLVPDLARAGAVVVLRASLPVAVADLQRAVEETGAGEVLVMPADAATVESARGWAATTGAPAADGSARVHVVASTSDLHVVTAVARWSTVPVGTAAGDMVPVLGAAVAAVHTRELPDADAAGAAAAVADLLARLDRPAVVVTVLAGTLVAAGVVDGTAREVARLSAATEVVVLSSGRRSSALVLGAE